MTSRRNKWFAYAMPRGGYKIRLVADGAPVVAYVYADHTPPGPYLTVEISELTTEDLQALLDAVQQALETKPKEESEVGI